MGLLTRASKRSASRSPPACGLHALRDRRIAIDDRTEGLPQWLEPWLKGAPLLDAFPADRAPDLLGAGCPNRALVVLEIEACLIERQAEPIEQRANSCFGFGNQFLVDHPDHPARRNPVEMIHHPDIVGIERADVGEIVAEALAGGEVLAKVRKATGHRVAACV